MDRYTERDEYGNADIIGVDSADLQLNLDFDDMNRVTEALNRFADLEDKIERGELVEVSTIRQRLHGLAYESQECGHPQIVELDEIDDLLDELSERSVENV